FAFASAVFLVFLFGHVRAPVRDTEAGTSPGEDVRISLSLAPSPVVEVPPESLAPEREIIEGLVRKRETASSLLIEFLTPREIVEISRRSKGVYSLSRLQAGRPYKITLLGKTFKEFEYEIAQDEKLVVRKEADGFRASLEPIVYDLETAVVDGTIESSLFEAVSRMGEGISLAMRLSEIFAWDVDFVRDIRAGDSFRAVVEKRYRKGEFVGYGKIAAARFVNQGEMFQGFLFEDENNNPSYFDEQGICLRKAFLKVPLAFRRISSGFNLRRLHPILKIRRPHPGIDYAAPKGTPVKAVGDGTIIKASSGRQAGRYIKIRHNSVYETSYMHLSRFAKGMKKGRKVYQGQVIAYVGSTGLSTGPHLDFRMRKNGRFIDPRKVKSPAADPVPNDKMEAFRQRVRPLLAVLDGQGVMQAAADPVPVFSR
ncbi:MAG: peptidoglycan DD-metalloendopeptidase family protein, partial [Thermodesulfobacteriota bacterium]|nr:peptidoglycan DD-metalloendopeptidase family protein [Thermodesulfobacteriota bacterium]